jgi:hypothetical protein
MKHLSELGVHCTLCKTKPAFDIVHDDRSRGGTNARDSSWTCVSGTINAATQQVRLTLVPAVKFPDSSMKIRMYQRLFKSRVGISAADSRS